MNTSTLAVTSLGFDRYWSLDHQGNITLLFGDDDGDGASDIDDQRTYNDANEITAIDGLTSPDWADPTHDAARNMLLRPNPAHPTVDEKRYAHSYDAWNRMVEFVNTDTFDTYTYEYDGLGRRIQKSLDGGDTYDYYHNESWQVVEVRKNDDANPLEQFVYDTNYIDALLIRWHDADTDGDLSDTGDGEQYYLYDASFNVIALLDEQGTTLERYRYTPYGDRVVLDADFTEDADNTSDYDNHRGFQGLLHDEESGLIENRMRYLDPLTGRFLTRDPLGYPDGFNAYAAYHVMLGGLDPSGMDTLHKWRGKKKDNRGKWQQGTWYQWERYDFSLFQWVCSGGNGKKNVRWEPRFFVPDNEFGEPGDLNSLGGEELKGNLAKVENGAQITVQAGQALLLLATIVTPGPEDLVLAAALSKYGWKVSGCGKKLVDSKGKDVDPKDFAKVQDEVADNYKELNKIRDKYEENNRKIRDQARKMQESGKYTDREAAEYAYRMRERNRIKAREDMPDGTRDFLDQRDPIKGESLDDFMDRTGKSYDDVIDGSGKSRTVR